MRIDDSKRLAGSFMSCCPVVPAVVRWLGIYPDEKQTGHLFTGLLSASYSTLFLYFAGTSESETLSSHWWLSDFWWDDVWCPDFWWDDIWWATFTVPDFWWSRLLVIQSFGDWTFGDPDFGGAIIRKFDIMTFHSTWDQEVVRKYSKIQMDDVL